MCGEGGGNRPVCLRRSAAPAEAPARRLEGAAACRPAAGQRLKLFLRQVRLRHAEEIRPEWTAIHNLSRKCSFRSCSKLPNFFLAAFGTIPNFLIMQKENMNKTGAV